MEAKRDGRGSCSQLVDRRGQHPKQRQFAGSCSASVNEQRRVQCGEVQLVDAEAPRQRMAAQRVDECGASKNDSGLRSAEQFIACLLYTSDAADE